MDKPEPDFTADDLLAQISTQLSVTEEGLTTRELCEGMGMPATNSNMSQVRRQVTDLVALGKVEYAGKKHSMSLIGAIRPVPAWKLIAKKE